MSSTIFGRANELKTLDRLLNSNKPEFLAIYGRRRVGPFNREVQQVDKI